MLVTLQRDLYQAMAELAFIDTTRRTRYASPLRRAPDGHAGACRGIGNPEIIRYLNRLSSLLFILARAEDLQGRGEVRLAKGDA
jgi:cob(I)alamin adenosyltransferase